MLRLLVVMILTFVDGMVLMVVAPQPDATGIVALVGISVLASFFAVLLAKDLIDKGMKC